MHRKNCRRKYLRVEFFLDKGVWARVCGTGIRQQTLTRAQKELQTQVLEGGILSR